MRLHVNDKVRQLIGPAVCIVIDPIACVVMGPVVCVVLGTLVWSVIGLDRIGFGFTTHGIWVVIFFYQFFFDDFVYGKFPRC